MRQTTLEYLTEPRAQLAINARFFLPFPTTDTEVWVIGLAASDGRGYSAFETPSQSYAIVANAPALNVDAGNRAAIVTRDPTRADGLGVRESVTLWNTVSGSAHKVTVPAYRDASHPEALLEPSGPSGYSNEKSWYPRTGIAAIINTSSNSPSGRSVGSSLAVVARPR